MKRTSIIGLVPIYGLVLMVLVLLFAGCGKDDTSSSALGPFASTLEGRPSQGTKR